MACEPKFFVRCWLLLTLLALGVVATFNLLVDPVGAFPRLNLKGFESLRYLEGDRKSKAEMARRGDWNVILLGSSRVRIGFPADHPFVTTNRCCNLGLDGACLSELSAAFDLARQNNPLRHVILGLDWYMFSPEPPTIPSFEESHFSPRFRVLEFYCKQLLGQAATERSWQTFRRWRRGDVPPLGSSHGFYDHHHLDAHTDQRELFERILRFGAGGPLHYKQDGQAMERLRHIVRVCRDEQIDLRIVIPPIHALAVELQYAGGHWTEFEAWKARLVQLLAEEGVEGKIELWDFPGYTGPSTEPVPREGDITNRMIYHFESSHFTPVYGRLVLDDILGDPSSSRFGVKLTRSNLQPHLASTLLARAAYARTNAAAIAWVKRIVTEVRAEKSRKAKLQSGEAGNPAAERPQDP